MDERQRAPPMPEHVLAAPVRPRVPKVPAPWQLPAQLALSLMPTCCASCSGAMRPPMPVTPVFQRCLRRPRQARARGFHGYTRCIHIPHAHAPHGEERLPPGLTDRVQHGLTIPHFRRPPCRSDLRAKPPRQGGGVHTAAGRASRRSTRSGSRGTARCAWPTARPRWAAPGLTGTRPPARALGTGVSDCMSARVLAVVKLQA
jgi:hypothetical protein